MIRQRHAHLFLLTCLLFPLLLSAAPRTVPSLLRRATPSPADALPVTTTDPRLNSAEQSALDVLSVNRIGGVHRAAPFYNMPWIRDSFAWGMIPDSSGPLASYSTSELAYWLGRQRPFGGWITFQYSGWYDETPILIAAVLDAYRLTGDVGRVKSALPRLHRAWRWLHDSYVAPAHGSRCLLWATLRPKGRHWAVDWADQVARQGYTPQLEGLWYQATHALAALEAVVGDRAAAGRYARAASCIAYDANSLLWGTGVPAHRDVSSPGRISFYRWRPAGRDYFELDGNALLVDTVAPAGRRRIFLREVAAHESYLLGENGPGPARVVYGDYARQDYAPIHNWMAAGLYQNAYWPSVGGLLAIAASRGERPGLAARILHDLAARAGPLSFGGMGAATRSEGDPSGTGRGGSDPFNEWYRADGEAGGASSYGWSARLYLLALYRVALGIDDSSLLSSPADLVLRATPGPSWGRVERLGHRITLVNYGAGRVLYARLAGKILHDVVPAALLHDGSIVEVYHG